MYSCEVTNKCNLFDKIEFNNRRKLPDYKILYLI